MEETLPVRSRDEYRQGEKEYGCNKYTEWVFIYPSSFSFFSIYISIHLKNMFFQSNTLNVYPSFNNHSMARGIASRIFRSAFSESWKTITEPLRV